MNQPRSFIFNHYDFDKQQRTLRLYYGYDTGLEFCETYIFDFEFTDYDEIALDRALQLLFFVAGVSYYKAYLAPEIVVKTGQIDEPLTAFLGKTYQRGLGEFFYVNQLDPRTPITFPVNSPELKAIEPSTEPGQLIGLG